MSDTTIGDRTAVGRRTIRFAPFVLFLALWGFHMFFAGGALVPYRDTGEMVTNAATLGVAHPPGYPLYTLMGKSAAAVFPGNPSYRVNLLSALASALAGTVLFFLLAPEGAAAAALGAGLWATSTVFWELSSVSEMYTVGVLIAVLLFILLRHEKIPWALAAFLWGAGLGVRTDFLLLAPALFWMMARRRD